MAERTTDAPTDERPESPAILYQWAGAKARGDSPSVAELEAQGWTVEYVDPRYGATLMRKPAK